MKIGQMKELLVFLWKREKWWITIVIIILVLLGGLMIAGESTKVLAPFIYAIF